VIRQRNGSCWNKQVHERKVGGNPVGARGLAWPMLGRLGRLDSSSNLDGPISILKSD